METSIENSSEIYLYLPFDTDFFNKAVSLYTNNINNNLKFSIVFNFFENKQLNNVKNITILKNILPLILDINNHYKLYYTYSNMANKENITPYPYYIALKNKLIMINYNLTDIAIINDIEILNNYIEHHKNKLRFTTLLKVDSFKIENVISYLMKDTIYNTETYALAYDPCISAFVPPQMYNDLVTEEFPQRDDFMKTIEKRLSQLTNIPKKYAIFNEKSIDDFVNDGYIVCFKHPNLKPCTLEQRKLILSNMLFAIDTDKVVLRAFSDNSSLNISEKYEITNIQNHYDFTIMIYSETSIKTVTIHEAIISNCFIQFFCDIIDTPEVYTLEQTKEVFINAINKLDKMIKLEKNA